MPLAEITVFDEQRLFNALANQYCCAEDVAESDVAKYLGRYLRDIGATSILVESNYVDSDYLDDVSAFYVKCFEHYDVRCKRLHFFSGTVLDAQSFADIAISGDSASVQRLSDTYLGFIVARPLPKAVVGRTVLKTYESDNGRRNYQVVRPYKINLFGISLDIQSLAFQQQDRALAACATVALWSCFHKTTQLFHTTAPSPASITRSAVRVVMSRAIPSKGLEIYQICDAIRDVGLEPEVYQPVPGLPIASLIYSYLRLGQPVLLGLEIQNIGLHAITVNWLLNATTEVLRS